MSKINRESKTLWKWAEILNPSEFDALYNCGHTDPDEVIVPNDVLDIIVKRNGGIAAGYHIRSIISRVYGVEL